MYIGAVQCSGLLGRIKASCFIIPFNRQQATDAQGDEVILLKWGKN
jgi:hypothetical protein